MNNPKKFIEYISEIESSRDSVVTIGNFDGLHIGHMKLVDLAIKHSKENNLQSIVFSFDTHPQQLISGTDVKLLISNWEKEQILNSKGIDKLMLVPFDESLKNMSAYKFCDDILMKILRTKILILGEDARFGSERLSAEEIKKYLEEKDVRVYLVPLVEKDGQRISSTLIRGLILEGNLEKANEYLGRNFSLSGEVIHGQKRGSTELGFPTANLKVPQNKIIPKIGVYDTIVNYRGKAYKGATNIGINPTFGKNTLSIETYIIDFDKIIYGENIEIEFLRKIRDEIKFNSAQELIAQMKKDVEKIVENI